MTNGTLARRTAIAVALTLLLGRPAGAQTSTGVIEGAVTGAAGQPLAGAAVTARHVATDTPYRVKADDQGKYRFSALPPGSYEVTTAAPATPGTAIHLVKVAPGATATANFDPTTPLATKKELAAGMAQPPRFEIGGRVGWTWSDGVALGATEAGNGRVYDQIEPADSMSWGFTVGYIMSQRLEIEFLYDRQPTTLRAIGVETTDVGDFAIGNYLGLLSFHFKSPAAAARPYLIAGAGMVTYPDLSFTTASGETREIGGSNRLSGSVGGGLKVYKGRIGGRVEARWTPTYIKSQATGGWWCSDYWGCELTKKSQYSNQIELSGGVIFRF
jgi:Carboxypeptidase regulatory-like domain